MRMLLQHVLAGCTVPAVVVGTSSAETGTRLLLTMQAANPLPTQTLTQATVTHCHPLQLDVQLANQVGRGRVHITHLDPPSDKDRPLTSRFAAGDVLPVVVMGTLASKEGKAHRIAECSARSDVLAAARTVGAAQAAREADVSMQSLQVGQRIQGCDVEVLSLWL